MEIDVFRHVRAFREESNIIRLVRAVGRNFDLGEK